MNDKNIPTDEYTVPWYKRTPVIVAYIALIGVILTAIFGIYSHTGDIQTPVSPTPLVTQILSSTTIPAATIPTPANTIVITPSHGGTTGPVKSTNQIDWNVLIDWGIMDANFKISDIETGKSVYINTLGTAYEYDSINFIVEAKRSFIANIIFEAQFYDSGQIKFFHHILFLIPLILNGKQEKKAEQI